MPILSGTAPAPCTFIKGAVTMYIGLCVGFTLLSLIGLGELIRKFLFWLYHPTGTPVYMGTVLTDAENVENTVKSLITRIRWMELRAPVKLILVDKSGDPRVREIAEKIIADFPEVALFCKEDMEYNK